MLLDAGGNPSGARDAYQLAASHGSAGVAETARQKLATLR